MSGMGTIMLFIASLLTLNGVATPFLHSSHSGAWANSVSTMQDRLIAQAAALPPGTDDTPSGMVAVFTTPSCPAGWVIPANAQGRLMVGVTDPTTVGVTVNDPIANQTDPTHGHNPITGSSNFDSKSIAAANCCNTQGAASGTQQATAQVVPTGSNLPFIQLSVCQKQ
ncbi:MAG TPA: hypothetical protein VKZ53_04550 [Candidatus Angelobacter sp.]|nr:hypothetical protein [Candidatus Angelobacter sp.]